MATKPTTEKGAPMPEMGKVTREDAGQFLAIYGENPAELVFPKDMPESDYLSYGTKLGHAMEYGAWRVGDFVNFGMGVYGYKDYEKIGLVTGLSEQFLRACASVAGRFPGEHRLEFGMEKARLMLARKNDKETLPKLIKRLGGKTHAELRKMGATGSGGNENNQKAELTATELYEATSALLEMIERFDSKKKLEALVAFEKDEQTGGAISATANMLKALSDQINDCTTKVS